MFSRYFAKARTGEKRQAATAFDGSQRGRSESDSIRPSEVTCRMRLNAPRASRSAPLASQRRRPCTRSQRAYHHSPMYGVGLSPRCQRRRERVRPIDLLRKSVSRMARISCGAECARAAHSAQDRTGHRSVRIELGSVLTDTGRRETVTQPVDAICHCVSQRTAAEQDENKGGRPECTSLRQH